METQQSQQPTNQERRESRQEKKLDEQQSRKKIKILKLSGVWLVVILVVGGLTWGLARLSNRSSAGPIAFSVNVVSASDQIEGNREAETVLVEYSDFQCPACGVYHPIIKQITKEFGGDIAFVYRHFPLRQIHQNAELAARAAEAAGKQGKFWEMHGLIFENQKEWSNQRKAKEFFEQYAESLGLNASQFKADIDLREIKDKVNADYQSGLRFGVDATPTFFLNGERLQNPRSSEEFKSIIQTAVFK